MVEWAINELVSHNVLSGPALSLWLHLKGLAWARGECDPTDEYLAQLMGGVTTEMVRLARRELRERCLLLEYRKAAAPGVRWLIPLPVRAGLRGSLPAEVDEQVALAEAGLRQMVAGLEAESASACLSGKGNSPQATLGANAICPKGAPMRKEKDLGSPPEGINAREGGAGGRGIHPKQGLAQIQPGPDTVDCVVAAGPADATGEQAALISDDRQHLAAFLIERGIFASVAGNLARDLLARMSLPEAQVYALAQLRAVQASNDGHGPRSGGCGRELEGEQVIGRWVARLREQALVPGWALAQAAWELGAEGERGDLQPEVEVCDGESAGHHPDGPACILLHGQPARPGEVWQAAQAQLRVQMSRGTYEAWLLNSRCIAVENQPEGGEPTHSPPEWGVRGASPPLAPRMGGSGDKPPMTGGKLTLVVQVPDRFAAQWLELRLKRLIVRTLESLVARPVDVRFLAPGESPGGGASPSADLSEGDLCQP
jgi:hypothetical protein